MSPHEFKAWREKYGFTQSQAADKLGLSINDVADSERATKRGESKPSTILKEIERACNSFDRKYAMTSALKLKIKAKIHSKGLPGHITPEVLQEILLEIVDVI